MAPVDKELGKKAGQVSELLRLLDKIAVSPIPGLPGLKKRPLRIVGKGYTGEQKMNHTISTKMRPK